MSNQELEKYIKQARQTGKTDDQIRQELLGAGWKEEQIDSYITTHGINLFKILYRLFYVLGFLSFLPTPIAYIYAIGANNKLWEASKDFMDAFLFGLIPFILILLWLPGLACFIIGIYFYSKYHKKQSKVLRIFKYITIAALFILMYLISS